MSVDRGALMAKAGEALIGVPFLLHGRDPARGLDCAGVVAVALAAAGVPARMPERYPLRVLDGERYLQFAAANGLVAVMGGVRAGDVVFCRPSGGQFHLMVASGPARWVHAHAGLRRVVALDGACPWPVVAHWRLNEGG